MKPKLDTLTDTNPQSLANVEVIEIIREKVILQNGEVLKRKVGKRMSRAERVKELKIEFGSEFRTVEFDYNKKENDGEF